MINFLLKNPSLYRFYQKSVRRKYDEYNFIKFIFKKKIFKNIRMLDICCGDSYVLEHINEFIDEPFEYVLTVCDSANELCPVFPNGKNRIQQARSVAIDHLYRALGSLSKETKNGYSLNQLTTKSEIARLKTKSNH